MKEAQHSLQFHDPNLVTYTHDQNEMKFFAFDSLHHDYVALKHIKFPAQHFANFLLTLRSMLCNILWTMNRLHLFSLADKVLLAFTTICNNNFLIECLNAREFVVLLLYLSAQGEYFSVKGVKFILRFLE